MVIKTPGWLGDIGDCTTQLYRDYHLPIEGSLLSSQYKGMPRSLLTWKVVVSPVPDCWIVCLPFFYIFGGASAFVPYQFLPKSVKPHPDNVVFKEIPFYRQVFFFLPENETHLFQAIGWKFTPPFSTSPKVSGNLVLAVWKTFSGKPHPQK